MDRRATLATFLGKKSASATVGVRPEALNTGLAPYTGTWDFEKAAHLLRRTMYGVNYVQIKDAVDNGLDATLNVLLEDKPMPQPPVNYDYENDPNVPIGETWINAPFSLQANFNPYRNRSLNSWTYQLMREEGVSIREKMTLFWHNHFVTADINDPKFTYDYINLLRQNALGNFRQLVKDITINASMLRYLNGNQNRRGAPNENYSRELLELFSIGKGPIAGPGDYTNYTEHDIQEMARVLTGWRDTGYNDIIGIPVGSSFVPNRHDTGNKQLSHRFDSVVISNGNENEYATLVDIIFQKDEVARFICRKLYRWFVYYEITSQAEMEVIEPMAQILIDNNYDIKPALDALLRSEHFFDNWNIGCMIKHPIDFLMSMMNQFEITFSDDLAPKYSVWWVLATVTPALQMTYYAPPDVAGWKAYYQEPLFYRIWINSVTLPIRMGITNLLALVGAQIAGENVVIDVLEFVSKIDEPLDPNAVIAEFASILFPKPLPQVQLDYLKSVLLPGLPDFEWTVEYGEYLDDPTNDTKRIPVETKLRFLVSTMLSMPEFYLS